MYVCFFLFALYGKLPLNEDGSIEPEQCRLSNRNDRGWVKILRNKPPRRESSLNKRQLEWKNCSLIALNVLNQPAQ